MKKIILLIIIALNYQSALFGQGKTLCVVPEPREYKFTAENFSLKDETVKINLFFLKNESLDMAADDLKSEIQKNTGITVNTNSNSEKEIEIGIPSEDSGFKNTCRQNDILPDESSGEDSYKLLITRDKIIIASNYPKGLYYGIQTLKQIIRGNADSGSLPGVKISDYPALKYRALMDDISRGPLPTLDFIKYQIRRIAEMKMNLYTPYIEHVVKTKSHPEFAPEDGSITVEEWKELSDYASKYFVQFIGNFQSFGHFNNILNTKEYAHLGESGTLISPLLPESYKFLEDIYSEMIPSFSAPFFSINCDETFDLGKAASKKLVDSLGYAEVYYRHIIKLYDIVKKYNKQVIVWGDVLLEHPELLKKLPKDIIVGTWTYDDLDDFSKFIDPIKQEGLELFVTPGVLNSSRLFPNYNQCFGNIKGFVNAAVKYGAPGMINTVWDDGGNSFFSNDWLGVAYSADKSWNPQSQDSSLFESRFMAGIYGDSESYFTEAVHTLMKLSDYEPTDGMNDKVLFENLLPDSAAHLRISLNDWDKVAASAGEARNLMNQSSLRFYKNDRKYFLFICDLYSALADERADIIEAAKLYAKADSLFPIKQNAARKLIVKSISLISRIIQRETGLKFTYEKLWLQENHTYALDRITGGYQKKIDDFADVKMRLFNSLKKLDSGLTIPSAADVRLGISELPGRYFREWLMVNPLPNADHQRLSHTDYLKVIGGELNVVPKVTQEFYFDSNKYRWSRVASGYQDIVDLSEIYHANNENSVTYAFATIESPLDTTVKSLAGCEGGIQVILNGTEVFSRESAASLIPDQFPFDLNLHKGINSLMLKISQTEGKWGFTFRLDGTDVRSRKNRYKIILSGNGE